MFTEIPGQPYDATTTTTMSPDFMGVNDSVVVMSQSESISETSYVNTSVILGKVLISIVCAFIGITAIALITGISVIMVIRSKDNARYSQLVTTTTEYRDTPVIYNGSQVVTQAGTQNAPTQQAV